MPTPLLIPLIAAGVGAASKGILAATQAAKAKKLANRPRPEQQVPESVQEATANAQQAYQTPNLLNSATTNLRSNAADANYALQQSGGNTNAITAAIAGKQNDALNSLYQEQQQRKDSLRSALGQQLNQQGQYEQSNFEVNKMQPYLDAIKAAALQRGAATQNLGGAINDVVGGLTSVGGMKMAGMQNADLLKALGIGGEARVEGTGTQLPSQMLSQTLKSAGGQTGQAAQSTGVLAPPPSNEDLQYITQMITGGGSPTNKITPINGVIPPINNGVNNIDISQLPNSFPQKEIKAVSGMSRDELMELAKTPDGLQIIQTLLKSMGLLNKPQ